MKSIGYSNGILAVVIAIIVITATDLRIFDRPLGGETLAVDTRGFNDTPASRTAIDCTR